MGQSPSTHFLQATLVSQSRTYETQIAGLPKHAQRLTMVLQLIRASYIPAIAFKIHLNNVCLSLTHPASLYTLNVKPVAKTVFLSHATAEDAYAFSVQRQQTCPSLINIGCSTGCCLRLLSNATSHHAAARTRLPGILTGKQKVLKCHLPSGSSMEHIARHSDRWK